MQLKSVYSLSVIIQLVNNNGLIKSKESIGELHFANVQSKLTT